MFKLSQKSLNILATVHPDLQKVVKRAIQITPIDFTVMEGIRSVEQQKKNVAKGVSQTMNSRHLTGHAVDLVPLSNGKISWDWPLYFKLEKAVKQAAKELNVPIEWGGDWKKFKDGPHWQLPFDKYPKTAAQKLAQPASVASAEPITNETSSQAATKSVAVGGTGVASGTAIALDPVLKGVEVLTTQQGELTSGDYVKIVVALVIIIGTIWYAWKKAK